ncbi:MAG: helix-turn-helix transcriptional regulator [Clostridia bacterium]|nr:helix-turn-helix transcriptional regulator [Clostridia bacterium]
MIYMKIFRERLKELRKNNNLSQKQLADILKTNNSSICDWECGRTEPNIETVALMADFFECSIDYLVGREDDFGVITLQKEGFAITEDERRLVEVYRKLDIKNRLHVSTYAEIRLEEQGDRKGRIM